MLLDSIITHPFSPIAATSAAIPANLRKPFIYLLSPFGQAFRNLKCGEPRVRGPLVPCKAVIDNEKDCIRSAEGRKVGSWQGAAQAFPLEGGRTRRFMKYHLRPPQTVTGCRGGREAPPAAKESQPAACVLRYKADSDRVGWVVLAW